MGTFLRFGLLPHMQKHRLFSAPIAPLEVILLSKLNAIFPIITADISIWLQPRRAHLRPQGT